MKFSEVSQMLHAALRSKISCLSSEKKNELSGRHKNFQAWLLGSDSAMSAESVDEMMDESRLRFRRPKVVLGPGKGRGHSTRTNWNAADFSLSNSELAKLFGVTNRLASRARSNRKYRQKTEAHS